MPGPPRKRDAERRRTNDDGIATQSVNLDELIKMDVEIPVAPEHWEHLTVQFWDAFTRSGQAIFYEPSDWIAAYTLMETLDRWLKPQEVKIGERDIETVYGADDDGEPLWRKTGKDYLFEEKIVAVPGGVITAVWKALGDLMAMEGPRRRLRIELERKAAKDAALGVTPVPITQSRDDAFRRAAEARQEA